MGQVKTDAKSNKIIAITVLIEEDISEIEEREIPFLLFHPVHYFYSLNMNWMKQQKRNSMIGFLKIILYSSTNPPTKNSSNRMVC